MDRTIQLILLGVNTSVELVIIFSTVEDFKQFIKSVYKQLNLNIRSGLEIFEEKYYKPDIDVNNILNYKLLERQTRS